jgi:DMSO/TMAO reductase YedYZ molybdopterin-dependent catalytic subunit
MEEPIPPGPISYARSVPREKAVQPEVLVAYQMNGRDLGRDHGYPVRAIVPGHYGMASVKWLTRIQAVREPFQGYWQTSPDRHRIAVGRTKTRQGVVPPAGPAGVPRRHQPVGDAASVAVDRGGAPPIVRKLKLPTASSMRKC